MCSILAIATIEEFQKGVDDNPVYDRAFSLNCVGAGHNRIVTWTKDGSDISNEEFDDRSGTEISGNFSYEQKVAYERIYDWINPVAVCGDVSRHDGSYKCEVTAVAGDTERIKEQSVAVKVQCK